MKPKSKTISKCQISGSNDLKSIMFLGYLPPPTIMKKINSKIEEETFYPADLMYSPTSKLVQLNTIVNKEIPIFSDSYVDKEFGTGCVKVTPAHDPNDFEMGIRNNLEVVNIFNPNATLNDNVPTEFKDLDRFDARKLVVKKMGELNLLKKIVKVYKG